MVERDGETKTFSIDPYYKASLFGFSYPSDREEGTKITQVTEGGSFEKAGIKAGDIIKSVDGVNVSNAGELSDAMNSVNKNGSGINFLIERDGTEQEFMVQPAEYETYTLGFNAAFDEKGGNALDVIKYSFVEVKYWIVTTVASLGQLITGKLSMNDVSGPVGIVNVVGSAIDQSKSLGIMAVIIQMLYMSVLLSANLGVMNLLPLPALDGGRLVFILIEAIRGKPVDREKEGFVHFAGLVVLMLFMVFVMYNDIIKIIK